MSSGMALKPRCGAGPSPEGSRELLQSFYWGVTESALQLEKAQGAVKSLVWVESEVGRSAKTQRDADTSQCHWVGAGDGFYG